MTIESTTVALGQAHEVDTAGQLAPSKTVALGQAGELDTGRPLVGSKMARSAPRGSDRGRKQLVAARGICEDLRGVDSSAFGFRRSSRPSA